MIRNNLHAISTVWVTAIILMLGSTQAYGQEIDFEYRCTILENLSATDQTTTLPECVKEVYVGDTFYVEFWASDSGTTNTGLISAYTDMNYMADFVTCNGVGHTNLFNLFRDGYCDDSMVDELGGSQLSGGVGVEPEWARVAYVEFTATASGLAEFVLTPAQSESSAYNYGLVLPSEIRYGSCKIIVRERGACCVQDTCTENSTEEECITNSGKYQGDGYACGEDSDGDDVWGCDDVCPISPALAGVDDEGRPLGDIDIEEDCIVDLADYAILQNNFSGPKTNADECPLGDLDGDCDVDLEDHHIMLENFSVPSD